MKLFVEGKGITLVARKSIGKGGEADVYDAGGGLALKVWKPPDHPDFLGWPEQARGAVERIQEQQQKLPAFPRGLPDNVISPLSAATDRSGTFIQGYTMRLVPSAYPLMNLGQRSFRQGRLTTAEVVALFVRLRETLVRLHGRGVVIGDFNDLNVLVSGGDVYLIDADSYQFGSWICRVFTERFVDPVICDPGAPGLVPVHPHAAMTDWYAFAAMLFRSLLFVDAFGGVYKPKPPAPPVPLPRRPLERISLLHPGVTRPAVAAPPETLPDDLLHFFEGVFEKDHRSEFPLPFLETLEFVRCVRCGLEHARTHCPVCQPVAVAGPVLVRVRGAVTVKTVIETSGRLVATASVDGELRWLLHEGGQLTREDGEILMRGRLDPTQRFAQGGTTSLIGTGSRLSVFRHGAKEVDLEIDPRPDETFAASARRFFWTTEGSLFVDGRFGPELVGQVLAGQTSIWAGPGWGFGFYRAGLLWRAVVFEERAASLNDSVDLPRPGGRLVRAACHFSERLCCVALETVEQGRLRHSVALVARTGGVMGVFAVPDEPGVLGACLAGTHLLVPSDEGIVRYDLEASSLRKARVFSETAGLVDSDTRLLPGRGGLFAVTPTSVRLLLL